MEDPGGFVDEHRAETLWIVSFEALDHEFDRRVILFRSAVIRSEDFKLVLTIFAMEKLVMSNTIVCSGQIDTTVSAMYGRTHGSVNRVLQHHAARLNEVHSVLLQSLFRLLALLV